MNPLLRSSWLLAIFTLSACGDSGAPNDATSSGSSASSMSTTGGGAQGGADAGGVGGVLSDCLSCGAVSDLGTPAVAALTETSGLAASAAHDDVFYAHNDSGDSARFFAFRADGTDLGTYEIKNATAVDWEAMSRGPCGDPSKSCLYFGDIGDNLAQRSTYAVYRVEEPASLRAGTFTLTAEVLRFRYPGGPHNAEALMVHPTTGEVFVVTKSARKTQIYVLPMPLDPSKTVTATLLGEVLVPDLIKLVTGADLHPAGTGILLRTYSNVHYYPVARGESVQVALSKTPCEMPPAGELQGETVAWTATGDGYRTLAEGRGQALHGSSCPIDR